jgi:hypothetical protein
MEGKRSTMSQSAGAAAGERSAEEAEPALAPKTVSFAVEQGSEAKPRRMKSASAKPEAKGDGKRSEAKQTQEEHPEDVWADLFHVSLVALAMDL